MPDNSIVVNDDAMYQYTRAQHRVSHTEADGTVYCICGMPVQPKVKPPTRESDYW